MKFPVSADVVDELDVDFVPINIARKIEEIDLEYGMPIIEGRPRAEVGGCVMALTVDSRADRVDSDC